ncbi:MAG: 6-phosphogluconolactonase [Phycisphaerales bacterium]|nr:6-phosphogluconolactonase [Phycisphaerales bacterium]
MTSDSGEKLRPYALDDALIDRPNLSGAVVVGEAVEDVIDTLASDLLTHANNCVRQFGDFHIALCGGRTPIPLYRRLMLDPAYRAMPWRRTHLWLVDERRVPFDHEESNWRMIREIIGDHADIPPVQLHPIFALSPTADREYEQTLKETLAWREKGHDRLDYVLLGMGEDGHIASLFPGSPVTFERDRLVSLAEPSRDRVTMTLGLINAARFVSVFVTGEHKHAAVRKLAGRGCGVSELPALGLTPLEGELIWYLDRAAAGAS